jgi:hypothetical protein
MVTVATIPSYGCLFLHPHHPAGDRPVFGRHLPPGQRVCEMVLPSGKYSIYLDNKQINYVGRRASRRQKGLGPGVQAGRAISSPGLIEFIAPIRYSIMRTVP